MASPDLALAIESWMLYSLGLCFVLSRLIARLVTLRSLRKLQSDDWLMCLVLAPFTAMVVCANKMSTRKMRFIVEELQIITVWLLKACLIILYRRIFPAPSNAKERRYLVVASAYCLATTFVILQALLPAWCYPMHLYWSKSAHEEQCSSYFHHTTVSLTFDIITTLATVVLPLVFIPTPRKYLLGALLLLGLLALVAGIAGRVSILKNSTSTTYLSWYVAEITLILLFANLPFLASLTKPETMDRIRSSKHLNLTQWPRQCRESLTTRPERQRLSSVVTITDTLTPPSSRRPSILGIKTHGTMKKVGSVSSMRSVSKIQTQLQDDHCTWGEEDSLAPTAPTTPVRTLTLADPPPELEMVWTTHRSLTRVTNPEASLPPGQPQWPLR